MERSIDYAAKKGTDIIVTDPLTALFTNDERLNPREVLEDHLAGEYVRHAVQVVKDYLDHLRKQGVFRENGTGGCPV